MCQICVDWEKGKLNISEAKRNLGELYWSSRNSKEEAHYVELAEKLEKLEDESS